MRAVSTARIASSPVVAGTARGDRSASVGTDGAMRVLVPLLLAAAFVVPLPAEAAPPTCEGQAATIVGTPGLPIVGTDGNDVIVADDATGVDARAGDDLVCVTGDSGTVTLGPGADVFRGGPSSDWVRAEPEGGVFVDDIATGAGYDWIEVTGVRMAPGARIDGGADGASLILAPGSVHLAVDARTREMTVGAERRWWWAGGVTSFRILGATRVDFVGSDQPESLYLDDAMDVIPGDRPSGVGEVRMGGGADSVAIVPTAASEGQMVDGGAGDDTFQVTALSGRTRADLASGRVDLPNGARLPVVGVEEHRLYARRLEARGTAGPDDLLVIACWADVRTRGGGDEVRLTNAWASLGEGLLGLSDDCPRRSRIDAGKGADRVSGFSGPDHIFGRAGRDVLSGRGGRHDVVHGGPGVDRCGGAETTRSCERPAR